MERTEDTPRPRDPGLAERARRLIRPAELASDEPLLWSAGKGTDVWDLFLACMTGDLAIVQRLIAADPSLVRAHYEYRTPLSFAVRENQIEIVVLSGCWRSTNGRARCRRTASRITRGWPRISSRPAARASTTRSSACSITSISGVR